MGNDFFKRHLIRKLIVAGAFAVLTIAAVVAITVVNAQVIMPNEGFITEYIDQKFSKAETIKVKNSLGDRLAIEIEQEGIVLAKNDDNCLPFSKDVKHVNVFGYDVMEWIISNSGSGSADGSSGRPVWGILEALDDRGITYNQDIINYYKNWNTPRNRDTKSYSSNYSTIYRLTNPSLSNNQDYADVYNQALNDGTDTAIVCIGRYGGEHLDPPHRQVNNNKATNTRNQERGYLEITLEEEELLYKVGQDYEHVVVIINSTNVMQMDFMNEIDGLDACLLVGPTGTIGAKAIPQILWGDLNPSGRCADTWPLKHEYNVAYYTNGYWPNDTGTDGNKASTIEAMYYSDAPSKANLANGINTANFADYYEGIYVGYRWFETADAEGFWDDPKYGGYNNVVAYPFGYGLSYTSFDWEFVDSKPNKNNEIGGNEDIELKVKVTNTGEVAGRDVVEVYLTAPYYRGQTEKSFVKLIGFQKTRILVPGESEIVTLTVHTRDFSSFDCYDSNNDGHAGYEMDDGSYEVKFMTNAHTLKAGMANNVIKFNVPKTIHIDEDTTTGNEVKPLFTGDNAIDGISCDGLSIGEPIDYLHRNNFAPLMTEPNPCRPWNTGLETCDDTSKPTAYSTNMAKEWDNATVDAFGKEVPTGEPTFASGGDLKVMDDKGQITELGIKLASDYNAEEWDALLDQLTWNDAITICKGQNYSRPGMKSVGLTKLNNNNFSDAEGASQVGATVNGNRLTAYPDPCLQAQTWNEDMLYQFGLSEAKDMALGGKDFLYGPASNIHRVPYGGRHAEYHSEDGFLAGRCLANVTKGLSDGGKNGFIKHFAINDTEYHRVGLFTWLTEQALREIYLRPFEESVKRGEACALMSSFNRVGAIWTGGSTALIQGVLRNEWGFNGMTITDYTENGTLQNANMMFRAGGNYVLSSSDFSDPGENNATGRFKWRLRESGKQVIYGTLRPLYTNYLYNNDPNHKAIVSSGKANWVWWKPALYCAEAFVIVVFAFGFVCALLPTNPKFRESLKEKFGKKKGDQ